MCPCSAVQNIAADALDDLYRKLKPDGCDRAGTGQGLPSVDTLHKRAYGLAPLRHAHISVAPAVAPVPTSRPPSRMLM